MKTIRQIYTYLITLISLEVVVWGMIRLARTFTNPSLGLDASSLAGALALLLVGLPIFLLHWWMAQRQATKEEEERFSLIRALFLYAAFLGTLIPVIQNVLVLVNHFLLSAVKQPHSAALFGGSLIWSDNLIAIFMNALVGGYVFYILRQDWETPPPNANLSTIRRLSRYLMLIYGLAMLVAGVHEIIRYLFSFAATVGGSPKTWLANGLALLVVGIPLWLESWRIIQRSLEHRSERTALLRQITLFLLSLFSAVGILIPLGIMADILLSAVLGDFQSLGMFFSEIGDPLALALPLSGVWYYYSGNFRQTFGIEETLRRGKIFRKLYYYILSALGLLATFVGLQSLLSFLIDLIIESAPAWENYLRDRLAGSLSALAVGLPIWLLSWKKMSADAAQTGEAGDRARGSLIRKVYLYVALFIGVIGTMATAGYVSFLLFEALLGEADPDLLDEVLTALSVLVLFGGLFLAYHLSLLRRDNKQAQSFLADLHAQFPVLVLTTEGDEFAPQVAMAFQREMPTLPLAVHAVGAGVPDETMSQARAVILPGEIVAEPGEAIRVWLKNFSGARLAIPSKAKNWYWLFGGGQPTSALVKRTLKTIREMAEGDEVSFSGGRAPFQNVLYVFGVLFAIQILFSILVSFISMF
ncbi:MAG: hypothetical protein B6I38_09265 [Anaerolineaceae bacterium 4572_5.1]|nr:MAG: hypothetical protein B6I38_09265 [Anaerolineaceae bacterium 4572_5.1]